MAAFFAKTWFLWYTFAVLFIMRWFHVTARDVESEVSLPHRDESADPSRFQSVEALPVVGQGISPIPSATNGCPGGKPKLQVVEREWSGGEDLNLRPPGPENGILESC